MQFKRRAIFALAAALGASLLVPTASAVAAPATSSAPGIWVVKTPGQTIAEAILQAAGRDAAYRLRAVRMVDYWAARRRAGQPVQLLDRDNALITPSVEELASMRAALTALTPAKSGSRAGSPSVTVTTTVPGTGGPTRTASGPRPLVNGDDPNSFPVRGAPGSGRSFWQNMNLVVEGAFCTSSCQVTDRYTSRARITPGPQTAQVSATNLYSPNHGNFGNEHFEIWAICRGSICGDHNTGQLPANSLDYVNYPDRHNNVITIAITLWVYFKPQARYVPDGAKTNDCKFPATGSICRY